MSAPEFYNWLNIAQRLIYPPHCVLCDSPATTHKARMGADPLDLCANCESTLPRIAFPCPICGVPLPSGVDAGTACGQCQKRPPSYDQLTGLYAYKGAARYLIHQLKYQQRMPCARVLGSLVAQTLEQRPAPKPDCIIPVPLHGVRRRQRGFNQSLEIAQPIGRRLGVPIDAECCSRVRDTASQSTLTAKQRRQNLRRAFACVGLKNARHVAIVDDVVTTGATVEALATVLRQHGAHRIEVWTVGRA